MPPPPPKNETSLKEVYMSQTFRNQFLPKNEFEHSAMLIDSEMASEGNIHTMKHSLIVDSHVQTATIGNDELMNGLHMDMPFLHSGLSMAQRNPGLVAPYLIMFFSWRDALLLTKAKEGMENLAQHATGAKHTPQPFGAQGGYGSGLPQYQEEGKKKGIGEQIRGIFGGKKG